MRFFSTAQASTPAKGWGDLFEDRLDDVSAIRDPQLVGDGQKQRVGLRDGLVLSELFNEAVRLSGVNAAEDSPSLLVDKADLVLFLAVTPEIGMVPIIDQREDTAAYRDPWLAPAGHLFPGGAGGEGS